MTEAEPEAAADVANEAETIVLLARLRARSPTSRHPRPTARPPSARPPTSPTRQTTRGCHKARHTEDVRTIGARLQDHAERERWCSGTKSTPSPWPPTSSSPRSSPRPPRRTRRYVVDVPVKACASVSVEARDEDEAREEAAEDWTDYLDLSSLNV